MVWSQSILTETTRFHLTREGILGPVPPCQLDVRHLPHRIYCRKEGDDHSLRVSEIVSRSNEQVLPSKGSQLVPPIVLAENALDR